MLRNRAWKVKYTSEDGDLVKQFYVPTLESAKRYDRMTGFFSAAALALAVRGIEGLVRNNGRMRLIVGCTLEQSEIEAISDGEQLRLAVERQLVSLPLVPPDPAALDALELLAWMIGRGVLDVRIAVQCDAKRRPVPDGGIFHAKVGIVEDRAGDRLAWTGSLNESKAAWSGDNWESFSVYTSWGPEPSRVDEEEKSFARLWADQSSRYAVFDVPEAVRLKLLRFMPKDGLPRRLRKPAPEDAPEPSAPQPEAGPAPEQEPVAPSVADLRSRVWSFIRDAPSLPGGGAQIGEATAPVELWPHQAQAFRRMYQSWPPKLLIADEVGLGKTIQAGMLLRQAWLAGRAKRILVLAPKAVLRQWQIELREKFNLSWPIYDGGKLTWYPSPAFKGRNEREVGHDSWHREAAVIASSQLMRRSDRAANLVEAAEPWDLIVLDEAHHARRRAAGSRRDGGPNTLLKLMRDLKGRTRGMILLTATPMQVHPVEVWDLLDLLGLPPEWTDKEFLRFFEDAGKPSPSADEFERMASLFRSIERRYGAVDAVDAERLTELTQFKAGHVLRALRNDSSIPRRQLETNERQAAVRIMLANTPVRRLVSRNTRELLRRYFKAGKLKSPVARREVKDHFLDMSSEERALYDTVERYISRTYSQASEGERTAVGFVMTIYRRRLASSFVALRQTLCKRRDALASGMPGLEANLEDLPDDETLDDPVDDDEAARHENEALAKERKSEIDGIVARIDRLPPDSKLDALKHVLRELRDDGCSQVMVFTQYTDTMEFLRDALRTDAEWKLICFSGRGGEVPTASGRWQGIRRDDAKRRFRDGKADLMLCTDAAAEGLNFQFCGALVNYDMPWNPMRVEQRIGRIDRLGQKNKVIRIVNLHYENTVETDIYRALAERIQLFESVVGRLQPILAKIPSAISEIVLGDEPRADNELAKIVNAIESSATDQGGGGFDIDAATASELAVAADSPPSTIAMADLRRVIGSSGLMPPGVSVRPLGPREYELLAPGMTESVRVTTELEHFEEHSESLELWSPGSPLFAAPEFVQSSEPYPPNATLKDILDGG